MQNLKDKFNNGRIPRSAMESIDSGQSLEKNASNSYMRMKLEAKKSGVEIKLVGKNSAYRECGKKGDYTQGLSNGKFTQWYAWELFKAGKGNLASNPTTSKGCSSNHGWGIAIDVSGKKAQDWIKENGVNYGWLWYTKDGGEGQRINENWHFSYKKEKDKFISKNRRKNTLLVGYVILGISVVGLAFGFYYATRSKTFSV